MAIISALSCSSSSPHSSTTRTSPKAASSFRKKRPQIWIVFAIGFCCGYFHATALSKNHSSHHDHDGWWGTTSTRTVQCSDGRLRNNFYCSDEFSQENASIRSGSDPAADRQSFPMPQQQAPPAAGWKSIHVFVGDATDNAAAASTSAVLNEQQQRWFSQARQDELIAGLLNNKTNGYFIDLAANDATTFSNTFALEREYDWTGLCIEPNPTYWYNLSTLRTGSHVVGAVVGNRTGDSVHFRFENGDHGGIVGFDNGPRWRSHAQERTTVALLNIVENFESPAVMDYLSLDVEGAETFVLGNFPLDRYTFRLITAERLRGDIRQYLQQHGFRFAQKLTRWGESLWINEAFEHEMDLSVLDQFGFPLF